MYRVEIISKHNDGGPAFDGYTEHGRFVILSHATRKEAEQRAAWLERLAYERADNRNEYRVVTGPASKLLAAMKRLVKANPVQDAKGLKVGITVEQANWIASRIAIELDNGHIAPIDHASYPIVEGRAGWHRPYFNGIKGSVNWALVDWSEQDGDIEYDYQVLVNWFPSGKALTVITRNESRDSYARRFAAGLVGQETDLLF